MTSHSTSAAVTVLQVSDPHFGTEVPAVMAALERLSADLRPHLLILSGDITQRARRAQFSAARAFADRLAIARELVIAGNHDIPLFNLPARLFWPYRGWQRAFGFDLEPVIELPRLLAIGVRTTRRWRHKHGEVTATQIDRIARRLRGARPEQLKLVVTHQPLDVVTESDQENLIRGHAEARAVWCDAGADLFLAGHIHLPHLRALPPRVGYPAAVAGNLPMAVQAGTAISSRLRGRVPNSVNVIELGASGVRGRVRRFDYSAATAAFEAGPELPFWR